MREKHNAPPGVNQGALQNVRLAETGVQSVAVIAGAGRNDVARHPASIAHADHESAENGEDREDDGVKDQGHVQLLLVWPIHVTSAPENFDLGQ